MEKNKKKIVQNIALLSILALFMFSPLGTFVKVQVSRLVAFSPSTVASENPKKLSNFQWQLVDKTGNNINLQDYKGKIIFINFWATWCPPCIAEMPSMQKLYADYQDKIVFLFVTTDSFSKINAFLIKNNLNLPIYQSVTNAPLEMETESIPTTYLIDKHGNIVIEKTGVADWNSDSFRTDLNKML